jgi:hypothetical protein
MTARQRRALRAYLRRDPSSIGIFNHGDCIGADAQAHAMVVADLPITHIIIHPPTDSKARAWCATSSKRADLLILATLPYHARNRTIVDASDILLAAPAQRKEIPRSGTWATVRYARRSGIPVVLFLP